MQKKQNKNEKPIVFPFLTSNTSRFVTVIFPFDLSNAPRLYHTGPHIISLFFYK